MEIVKGPWADSEGFGMICREEKSSIYVYHEYNMKGPIYFYDNMFKCTQ